MVSGLKTVMQDKGITMAELELLLGRNGTPIPRGTLDRYIKVRPASIRYAVAIADVLKVSVDQILGRASV